MNYYIDFDNTLFNTSLFANEIFGDYLSNIDKLDKQKILLNLNEIISNSQKFVFPDSIPFLENLRKKNKLFLLSYSNRNTKYQTAKILGSGLVDYFDGLYITSIPKYELDIDYSNGIFIDDNPEDLKGLYSKNPQKLIRLRRKDTKYSGKDLDFTIEEYSNFDELQID